MLHKREKGFTLVELLIVIVVIAILATITLVSYNGIQDKAMDTKIKSLIGDIGKTLQLADIDGVRPSGTGYLQNKGTGTISVDSIVIDFTSMGSGYRGDIKSSNVNSSSRVLRHYACKDGFVIYASLNAPSQENKDGLASAKSYCGHSDAVAPTSGELKYNYAKVFGYSS